MRPRVIVLRDNALLIEGTGDNLDIRLAPAAGRVVVGPYEPILHPTEGLLKSIIAVLSAELSIHEARAELKEETNVIHKG